MSIESTYFHKMSISRVQDTKDEWGGTVQAYAPIPIMQLLPCAFSQSSRSSANTIRTESVNIVSYNPKVFCSPNLDIRAGDRITISFDIRTIGEFTASEPYLYPTHQEVPLMKEGEA